jgi:hypothetical protein
VSEIGPPEDVISDGGQILSLMIMGHDNHG